MVQGYQNEVLKGGLSPLRASEILTELCALLGNVIDNITITEITYKKVLLDLYTEEEKANRAKIRAEITTEYREWQESRNTKELVVELIRGLKYLITAQKEEWGAGSHQ